MSLLFRFEGKRVLPEPEALLIYPFKQIWERDESEDKERALKDLSYIEFFGSMDKSNPFRHLSPDVKHRYIVDKVFNGENYVPDKLVRDGIKFLEEAQKELSVYYKLWFDAKVAAEKMSTYLRNIDFSERSKYGLPVHKPADVQKAVENLAATFERLKDLESKVFEDLKSGIRIRGNKTIGYFNDPDNFLRETKED